MYELIPFSRQEENGIVHTFLAYFSSFAVRVRGHSVNSNAGSVNRPSEFRSNAPEAILARPVRAAVYQLQHFLPSVWRRRTGAVQGCASNDTSRGP
jgi:hypothetical protein